MAKDLGYPHAFWTTRLLAQHAREHAFAERDTCFAKLSQGTAAIANTAPGWPPQPGVHATFARDREYKRYGTVSLLAGLDLLTGQVHALVRDRHRSREFIEFLQLLEAAYPAHTAIEVILDNH
jgi:hypothetical protein